MLVAKGHEVWGDDVVVGGFKAGGGEGAGDKFAGGGIGGPGWLMRVEGAAVVFGWAKLVSGKVVLEMCRKEGAGRHYLLGGSCHFLSLALATGS